jgi:hypothetical protein
VGIPHRVSVILYISPAMFRRKLDEAVTTTSSTGTGTGVKVGLLLLFLGIL